MSQIEEAKGGWPPHDPIAHLAPHAPIQAQPETSQGSFHVIQQTNWRLPQNSFGNLLNKPPLFGAEWRGPVDWSGNNNKIVEWEKWNASTTPEIARPLATFGNASLTAMIPTTTEISDVKSEPIHPNDVYDTPKEDERKSSEHTNSYDVSASQSPSQEDEEHSNGSDEPIDVECMNQETAVKTEEQEMDVECGTTEDYEPMDQSNGALTKIKEEPSTEEPAKMDSNNSHEESQLLLNFSHRSFSEVFDASKFKTPSAESTNTTIEQPVESIPKPTAPVFGGFLHSGTSAFSNIEPSLSANREVQKSTSNNNTEVTPSPNPTSSSFCRPPGLGPVTLPPAANGQAQPLVCPICGFSCPSKFHYNSHMNTHGDHQCSMCDYTSRTEGRLKKHMRESHTIEEQLRAGLEVDPKSDNSAQIPSPDKDIPSSSEPSSSNFMMNLSTTMASILDSTATALAATMASSDAPSSMPTSLNIDITSTPNLLNSLTQNTFTSSAIDQIRAFTENNSLLSDGQLSLASALGVVQQAISSEPKTPEKTSNGETRRSSSGKVKILKCKQCGHQSMSKDDQWLHARTHIPSEKQLNCQHCNFVTEYKHHLEYHYRNHMGSKPFHCKKCAYTCVNKSMLNSHMKSHTNHYQFRCVDCTYATKYCHSLKLHLKKYNHRRHLDGDESPEGEQSPNQLTVPSGPIPAFPNLSLDKKFDSPTAMPQAFNFPSMVSGQSLAYAGQMLLKHHQNHMDINPLLTLQSLNDLSQPGALPLKCPLCQTQCATQEEQVTHNMSHFMNASVPTTLASLYNLTHLPLTLGNMSSVTADGTEASLEVDETTDEADQDQDRDHEFETHSNDDEMEQSSDCAASPAGSKFSASSGSCDGESQKRKAFKLEQISQRLQGKSPTNSESNEDKDDESRVESSVSPSETFCEVVRPNPFHPVSLPSVSEPSLLLNANGSVGNMNVLIQQACMAINVLQSRNEDGFKHTCCHCKMSFQDQALYQIHMGYHGYDHAFKCNRCGFTANDSLNFNLHLLQTSHD